MTTENAEKSEAEPTTEIPQAESRKKLLIVEPNGRPAHETFAYVLETLCAYSEKFDITVAHSYSEGEKLLQPDMNVPAAEEKASQIKLPEGFTAHVEKTRRGLRVIVRNKAGDALDFRSRENHALAFVVHEVEAMNFLPPYDLMIVEEDLPILGVPRSPRLRALGASLALQAAMVGVDKIGIIETPGHHHYLRDLSRFEGLLVKVFKLEEWAHVSHSLTGITFRQDT